MYENRININISLLRHGDGVLMMRIFHLILLDTRYAIFSCFYLQLFEILSVEKYDTVVFI
jgi:hypothetical protein